MTEVASLRGVTKRYHSTLALAGVDLEVRTGEIVALLGPNGAGKTTALNLLLGLRRPDAGEARLFSGDPRRPETRAELGVTPQETSFPATLRVRELVDLVRAHYAEPADRDALLRRFGLTTIAHRQSGGLSGGQRRRVALALAFAGDPRALFLDEPTTGLDVGSRRAVWEEIGAFSAAGGTVLLTSHYLEEAEALATRLVVIARGRVVAEGTVDEVRSRERLARIRFRGGAPPDVPGVSRSEAKDGWITLHVEDAGAVVRELSIRGVELADLEVLRSSLEHALVALTEDES